jgi:outer membrane receptor protein involved in Fe transport
MKGTFATALLAGTAIGGAVGFADPAFAQNGGVAPNTSQAVPGDEVAQAEPTQTVAPESAKPSAEIIVTGSRIPQPNLQSASPVTVVSSQEVKVTGTTRTEDLINALPQVFATQGANIANGASGTATVSLRGLGANRTLVLVNGKRLQAGDTGNPVPDINFVPSVMIKRVEVLTGGASSVYGADAVGGVINFILDTTFTGFRIDGQASVFNHHQHANSDILSANAASGFSAPTGWSTNGGAQDIAGMFGAAFDDGRGHVTAYATYRTQDPVLQSTRDFSFCALNAIPDVDPRRAAPPAGLGQTFRHDVASTGRNFDCAGSATSANGTFLQYDPNFNPVGEFQVSGNQFVPGSTPFNFNPFNYFQRPDERYTFGAFADYEISPAFRPYAELMFMDDHSDAQIAPSGDFGDTNTIACDNAMLSDQQRALICAPGNTFVGSLNGQANVEQAIVYALRRNVEGGGRDSDLRHDDFRVVAGLKGDAARGISYDAYYQFGRTLRNDNELNNFSVSRLGRALDVIAVDSNGNEVSPGTPGSTLECRAVFTGIDPNCVPYDIFQADGVSQAALNYLETPAFEQGLINETIAHADFTISGDSYGLKLPWAESGIGLNFGAEYRKESLDLKTDVELQTGDLAGGSPVPPVKGDFDVRELFGEVQLPIVEHNFIDEFTITAGYRYSNYHVAGNSFATDTYKIEAELAPIPDIRFRGSYNRAVRAPNIVELFFPQTAGLSGSVDPCAGSSPAATQQQCALTGVTAGQYGNIAANPANQYNGLFGGNPNLLPEKADTLTAGVILQPRFIPGLALTADYFDIKVKNLIGSPSFAGVFDACFAGDSASCALVHRAPGTGSLWLGQQGFVELTNQNFPGVGLLTKGYDFQGNYNRRVGVLGTLSVSFVGTYLTKLDSPSAAEPGQFASSTPSPKWRHNLRVGLTLPSGIGISARWRHFSAVHCDPTSDPECSVLIDPDGRDGPLPPERHPLPGNERLSSRDYFDLSLTARLANRLNLRLGANNILDRDPPVAGGQAVPGGFGNGNTYPQVYDSLGRYLFAGFTVDF